MQVVALLHDVVEDTPRSIDDVRDGFGETIAAMVGALAEDDGIRNYAQRKRALRAQVIGAGTPVVAIALADKIATLQHARITATRVRRRKLAHYDATLQLAIAAGVDEALCRRVAELLDPMTDAHAYRRLADLLCAAPGAHAAHDSVGDRQTQRVGVVSCSV